MAHLYTHRNIFYANKGKQKEEISIIRRSEKKQFTLMSIIIILDKIVFFFRIF